MSSRKILKKQITNACSLLYADCILYKLFVIQEAKKEVDPIVTRIVDLHNEFIQRANVREGKGVKGRVKMYYKKLREDFQNEVDKIGLEIAGLPTNEDNI